jgi:hypothetical protein
MLDRLHAVDWQSLNAGQMASWMADLISTNETKRWKSGAKLLEYLGEHAEALNLLEEYRKILSNDAPILAAPFFVEFLMMPGTQNKGTILHILSVLAGYKTKAELEPIHQVRAEKIHQSLLTNFDLYTPFINADEPRTRIEAMYLCSQFDEKLPIVIENLLDRIEKEKEPDELGKAVAAEIIFKAIENNIELVNRFREQFTQVLNHWIIAPFETISIRADATFYLLKLYGEATQPVIIKLLSNILKLPHGMDLNIPWFGECVDAFMLLGINHCTSILLDIFDDQTEILQIFDTIVVLLAIHFGADDYHKFWTSKHVLSENTKIIVETETPIKPIQFPLNELQINILDHLLTKDEIWDIETNLFTLFNLPATKSELQTLIAKD